MQRYDILYNYNEISGKSEKKSAFLAHYKRKIVNLPKEKQKPETKNKTEIQ